MINQSGTFGPGTLAAGRTASAGRTGSADVFVLFAGWLALGLVVYLGYGRHRSRLSVPETAAPPLEHAPAN